MNATKTELIYFRSKNTPIPETSIKLNGIKLTANDQVKYVGITFDEHLTFQGHIKILNGKLKRANSLISISRHYLCKELLMQIYYGQFYSHLIYGCQLWGQNENHIDQTITLQKKAVRLITFSDYQAHSSPLFKKLKLLNLTDIVQFNNIMFTHSAINKTIPSIFEDYFQFKETTHEHETVNSLTSAYSFPVGSLLLPLYKNNAGKESIRYICANIWNNILKELSIKNPENYDLDPFWINRTSNKNLKHILKQHFLENY